MLIDAGLSNKFWAKEINIINYLINRLLEQQLSKKIISEEK